MIFRLATLMAAFGTALADIDYAVYFDVGDSATSDNPFQRSNPSQEYEPFEPKDWRRVDKEAWPIFTDWGTKLDVPKLWYERGNREGNECENREDANYDKFHRQSPIMLQEDEQCFDRHKMINEVRGVCGKKEVKFYSTPYGLGATLDGCEQPPMLDHSLNHDIWTLSEVVVKTPGEHSIWDDVAGEERTFAGELQLGYKGSKSETDGDLEGHAENIGIVGIMLEVGDDDDDDDELELLIRGWEKNHEDRYASCDKTYDEKKCELVSKGDRSGDDDFVGDDGTGLTECEVCSSCCSDATRRLTSREDSLEKKIEEQDAVIKRLKEKLSKSRLQLDGMGGEDENEKGRRELAQWHKKCKGSFYCFMNLYKHTKTDYYYNYRGGLTYPPCTEIVYWRVMLNPLVISPSQLKRIEKMIYMHLDDNCELTTVGKRRSSDSCEVDVNRPRQALSRGHNLKMCDSWATGSATANREPEEEEEGEGEGDDDGNDDQWSTEGAVARTIGEQVERKSKASKASKGMRHLR